MPASCRISSARVRGSSPGETLSRTTGVFEAVEVLAKHDETYMPPEVAEALKESGYWREDP